jgi:hypothetical protein
MRGVKGDGGKGMFAVSAWRKKGEDLRGMHEIAVQ